MEGVGFECMTPSLHPSTIPIFTTLERGFFNGLNSLNDLNDLNGFKSQPVRS